MKNASPDDGKLFQIEIKLKVFFVCVVVQIIKENTMMIFDALWWTSSIYYYGKVQGQWKVERAQKDAYRLFVIAW